MNNLYINRVKVVKISIIKTKDTKLTVIIIDNNELGKAKSIPKHKFNKILFNNQNFFKYFYLVFLHNCFYIT